MAVMAAALRLLDSAGPLSWRPLRVGWQWPASVAVVAAVARRDGSCVHTDAAGSVGGGEGCCCREGILRC